ncbi:hypothetical protein MFORT_13268 [Mycolicibacterium fortuitum subsp. fortuitum DSM 46621 = ATCC 6841 = JCM 6387]|uniref:HTH araC/xylS-type domain-containing protein n=1 Tax=Mycolicibacterium fortuitum subsp. fortuitum DSM 46621 = ATCC 6841 = JCM 6387 TaxID=1214102 RepID=K0V2Z3_MYCFO|nr:hypothetical protein MFORT_13268 [Mycolicibacterium fortuitum subsp. fortuitum DSM 46621 = ATCC 6841 = JCM 6387]CRL55809.1 hypothetical protein CPGR_03117 [Mycolicibacterium fortuitum subsp. fortuitum DSM 46621 = ATCC 6841 = JCM 6387]
MKLDVFCQAFGRAFHMTPYQFASHFATTFRNRVGVTPTVYRRARWPTTRRSGN